MILSLILIYLMIKKILLKKIVPLWDPENFQPVTASNDNCHMKSKMNHKVEIPEDVIKISLK